MEVAGCVATFVALGTAAAGIAKACDKLRRLKREFTRARQVLGDVYDDAFDFGKIVKNVSDLMKEAEERNQASLNVFKDKELNESIVISCGSNLERLNQIVSSVKLLLSSHESVARKWYTYLVKWKGIKKELDQFHLRLLSTKTNLSLLLQVGLLACCLDAHQRLPDLRSNDTLLIKYLQNDIKRYEDEIKCLKRRSRKLERRLREKVGSYERSEEAHHSLELARAVRRVATEYVREHDLSEGISSTISSSTPGQPITETPPTSLSEDDGAHVPQARTADDNITIGNGVTDTAYGLCGLRVSTETPRYDGEDGQIPNIGFYVPAVGPPTRHRKPPDPFPPSPPPQSGPVIVDDGWGVREEFRAPRKPRRPHLSQHDTGSSGQSDPEG